MNGNAANIKAAWLNRPALQHGTYRRWRRSRLQPSFLAQRHRFDLGLCLAESGKGLLVEFGSPVLHHSS